jgi:hypothetical protein
MKPLLFLISFILISCSSLVGQSFKSGFSLGLVASQVEGDGFGGYNKLGYYGGLMVGYPINDRVEVDMQISVIQKGSRQNARPNDGIFNTFVMRLTYAEVPLYVHYRITKEKLYFNGGFSFGYLINAVERDEYGVIVPDPTVPEFRQFEWAALVGFSYQINDDWSVMIRGQYSLLPIRKAPIIIQWYYNGSQENNVITTSITHHF